MDDIQQQAQSLTSNVTDSSLANKQKKVVAPQAQQPISTGKQEEAIDEDVFSVKDVTESKPAETAEYTGPTPEDEDVVKVNNTGDNIPYFGATGTFGKDYSDATLADNGTIYHKFRKVKPYEIEYDGVRATVDSLNIKKALYQMDAIIGVAEDPRIAYYGYNKLPDIEKDSVIQGVLNGVVNTLPAMVVQAGGYVSSAVGHAAEGIGAAINDQDIIDFGNDLVQDTRDIVDTVIDEISLKSDEFGRGRNDLAEGVGSVAVSMGIGAVGKGALYAMSALEGASLGYQADVELGKRGISGFKALGLAGLAGAGGFAIGASTAGVQRYIHSTLTPAGGWVKMMKTNPAGFFTRLAAENGIVELFDAGTEAGQDLFASWIGKGKVDDEDWDQAGTTIIASLLVGAGISGYKTYKGRQTLQDHVNKVSAIADSMRDSFKKLSEQPGSPFTMEMFDQIVDRLKEGRSVPELAEIVKTNVLANVDRMFGEDVTPEMKKQFTQTVERLTTDGALVKLMDKVDTQIDTMLSSVYGDGELSQGQRDMFRVMMRGIAINQLVYRGLTPDQWMPSATSYLVANKDMRTKGGAISLGRASRDTYGNTKIQINTNGDYVNAPQTSLFGGEKQTTEGMTQNQRTSQNAATLARKAVQAGGTDTNLSGTIGAGAMRHEMGHVMNMFSGLENVPEFVSLMREWVETVLPNVTAQATEGESDATKKYVAEQEVLAKAFEYADSILKPLGLEGKTAEYMNMLLSVAQANTYIAAFKNYVDMFSKIAKQNDAIIKDIMKGFSPDDVAAFDEFCKSGKNETLDSKTLSAIYNALEQGITTDGAEAIKEKLGNVNFVGFQKNYRDYMGEQREFYERAVLRDRLVADMTGKLMSAKTGEADGSVNTQAVLDNTAKTIDAKIEQIKAEQQSSEESKKSEEKPEAKPEEQVVEQPQEIEVPTTEEIQIEEANKTLDTIGETISEWEKQLNDLVAKDDTEALSRLRAAEEGFDLDSKLYRRPQSEIEEVRKELTESLEKDSKGWEIRRRPDKNDPTRIITVAFGKSEEAKKLESKYRKAYGDGIADRILTSVAHSILLENAKTMDDVVEMLDLAAKTKQAEEERAKARKKEIDDITALFEPYVKDMTPANPEYNSLRRAEFLVKQVNNLKYDTENARDSILAYLEGIYQEYGFGRQDMDLSPQTIKNNLLKSYYMARGGLNNVLQDQAIQDKPEIKKLVQDNIRVINDVITVMSNSYYAAKSKYSENKEQERIKSEEFVDALKNPNSDKYITRDGDLVDIRNTPISTESYNWTSRKTYLTEQKNNIRRLHVALSDFGVANGWKDQGVEKANRVKQLAEKDEDIRQEVESRLGAIEGMDKSSFEIRKPQPLNKIDFVKENALEISEQVKEERKKTNGNARDIKDAIVKSLYDAYVSDFNENNKNFEEKLLSDEEFKAIKEQATQDALEEIYDKFVGSIDLSYITTKDDWVAEVQKLKNRVDDIRSQESIVGVHKLPYNSDDGNVMYYNKYFYPNIFEHLGGHSSIQSMDMWNDIQEYVENGIEIYRGNKDRSELEKQIRNNIYIAVGADRQKVMPLYNEYGMNGEALVAATDYLSRTKYAQFGTVVSPSILNSLIVEGIKRTKDDALSALRKDFSKVNGKFVDSSRLYFAAQDIAAMYHGNNSDFFDALAQNRVDEEEIPVISKQITEDKAWVDRQPKQKKNVLASQIADLLADGKPAYDMQTNTHLIGSTISPKNGTVSGGVSLGSRMAFVHNNNLREMVVLGHFVNLGEAYVDEGRVHNVDESIVAVYKQENGKPVTVKYGMDDFDYMIANDMPVFIGERMSQKEILDLVNWAIKDDQYAAVLTKGIEVSGSLSYKPEYMYDPFENKKQEDEYDDIVDLAPFLQPIPNDPNFYTLSIYGDKAVIPSSTATKLMAEWKNANITDQYVAEDFLSAVATTMKEYPNFDRNSKGVPLFKNWLDSYLGSGHMTVREFLEDGLAGLKSTKNSSAKTKWLNRTTFFMTLSLGFGNQARNLFGQKFAFKLGLDTMSNRVQQSTQEIKRSVQEDLVKEVFGGSLNKMVVWLSKSSADIPGVSVKLSDGQERSISRQELMTLYMIKNLRDEYLQRVKDHDKDPWQKDENGELKRTEYGAPIPKPIVDLMAPEFGGIERVHEKISKTMDWPSVVTLMDKYLTQEDKDAVDKVLKNKTLLASTNQEEGSAYYYTPVTDIETLFNGSWASRKDNGYMVFGKALASEDVDIYPMGLYDGVMKMASHTSLENNNFMAALKTIKTLFDLGAKYKVSGYSSQPEVEAVRLSVEKDLRRQFRLMGFDEGEIGSFKENAALLMDTVKKANEMRVLIESIIGASNFDALMKGLEHEANIHDHRASAMSAGAKILDKLTHSVMSSMLWGKAKSMVFNFGGNYAMFAGLSDSSSVKYMTVDFGNAVSHMSEAWKEAMSKGFILNRLKNAGISDQFERLSDMQRETLLSDVTSWVDKHKHENAADFMRNFDAWSKKLTKYGVGIASSLPDVAGIVLAYYATKPAVMKMAEEAIETSGIQGDVNAVADEIFENYMLQHISNSSYMTRGLVQKKLAQMGLASMVAFTNDQLLKGAQLANSIKEYVNTDDPVKKERLMKEIKGIAWSSGIYVAVQTMLISTLARAIFGDGLDDEEQKQLFLSLTRESIGQLLGFFQYGNLIQDSVVDGLLGGQGDMSIIPLDQLSKAFANGARGKLFATSQEAASLAGLSWYKMITNWMSAIRQLAATDDITGDDAGVFMNRMMGFSEGTALRRRNLRKTDDGEYKKVNRKKKKVEEDE